MKPGSGMYANVLSRTRRSVIMKPGSGMYANVLGPWTIEAHQEYDEVPVGPEPDKTWRYVDSAGHGHFWKDGYPTLSAEEEPCSCGIDEEEHTVSVLVCPHCREVIRPGMTSPLPGETRTRAGRLRVTLTYEDEAGKRVWTDLPDRCGRALLRDPVKTIPHIEESIEPSVREWRG